MTTQFAVTLGGETVTGTDWIALADSLVAKHGPGIPRVETIGAPEAAPLPQSSAIEPVARGIGNVDTEGKVRSLIHDAAAREAGFAPAQPIFERGTRVIELGVENARTARLEWEAKPTVLESCRLVYERVQQEQRDDRVVIASDLRMRNDGTLSLESDKGTRLDLEEKAFGPLLARTGIGGGAYLRDCWPELRALNVNHQMRRLAETEDPTNRQTLTLRTRESGAGRGVFAAVSERYQAYDIDTIARAIGMATPGDARGAVTYDGHRAKFEVLFHSTVQPEGYVAGEFFRAGCLVRSSDDGSGSIVISAVVWQNLCLNLIVIDEATQVTARIRHIGSVAKLAREFERGFAKALGKIEHFTNAWGYARTENIVERARLVDATVPHDDAEAFRGLIRGAIDSDLVPVRGQREAEVEKVYRAWERDESSATSETRYSRAALANAFTRYAHEGQSSRFAEDGIQQAAGALVYSKRPLYYATAE